MGYADYKKGVRRNDNPFSTATDPTGREKFKDWADGWLQARKEAEGKSFTGFCKAICDARSGKDDRTRWGAQQLDEVYGSQWKEIAPAVTKSAMGESSGSAGGYIVPVEYSQQLLRTLEERSFIYPRANIIPMGTAETKCPVIDATTAPAAAGISPYFGGANFKWGFSQAPARTAEMRFREVTLHAWDLLGYGVVSNQWLQDTPDGEGRLVEILGRAAAWSAEFAFLNGKGSDSLMPLGILNSPALIPVTRAGAGHIAQADVAKMWRSLMPSSVPNAIWACSSTAVEDLVKITGYVPNQGNLCDGGAGTIFTRPVFITEKLPALGTLGDLVLFDPSLYAVGVRQEVLIDVTDQEPSTFVRNQSMFRVWLRMAGLPQLNNRVTLQDTTTVVSAYVAIAA